MPDDADLPTCPHCGHGFDAVEIVEEIMTQHWDMAACRCWICRAGRNVGLRPRERHLAQRSGRAPLGRVQVIPRD